MKAEKAENLLAWWAQVLSDDNSTNGYPKKSAFVDSGARGGVFGHCPMSGSLKSDFSRLDALMRSGALSPRQYIAAFFAFVPWRDASGRHINCRVRAAAAECSLATLKLSKAKAVHLVMVSEDVIYNRPARDYTGLQAVGGL
jgi:hypothetical protein